jgi:hypothetical protein
VVLPIVSAELAWADLESSVPEAEPRTPTTRIENESSIEATPVEGDWPTAALSAPLTHGGGIGA